MKNANYKTTIGLLSALREIDKAFSNVVEDVDRQRGDVVSARMRRILNLADEKLHTIPIDELSDYKARIRTSLLKENGIDSLGTLNNMHDEELTAINGLGPIQLTAMRAILFKKANEITGGKVPPLTNTPESDAEKEYLLSIYRLRRGAQLRKALLPFYASFSSFTNGLGNKLFARTRMQWFFLGREKKYLMRKAAGDIYEYIHAPSFAKATSLLEEYNALGDASIREAIEDFNEHKEEYLKMQDEIK